MVQNADVCSLCGSVLEVEETQEGVVAGLRMPCPNRACPGKWTATEPGGAGVRASYDVPSLKGDSD